MEKYHDIEFEYVQDLISFQIFEMMMNDNNNILKVMSVGYGEFFEITIKCLYHYLRLKLETINDYRIYLVYETGKLDSISHDIKNFNNESIMKTNIINLPHSSPIDLSSIANSSESDYIFLSRDTFKLEELYDKKPKIRITW